MVAKPVHLLLYVLRQVPGMGIGEREDEELTVTEAHELRLALRIGAA